MKKTIRVKFLSNSPFNTYGSGATVNPSFLFLKTYYDLYGANTIEWLPWEAIIIKTEDEQVKEIVEEKPDVLALAIFVWNEKLHFSIAKKVKALLPDTIILLGGPQLDAHKNTNFFKTYPYVDWVCYGDGERSFQQLIDRILDKDLSKPLVNMVENVNGETNVYPYEIFQDELYWKTSPYLTNKHLVEEYNSRFEKHGYDKKQLRWAVEFARGCPYKCSFCDWSQNLTKKVKRRTHDWKADLDYFFEQNIQLVETDANFGQFKEDLQIFDYAMDLHKNNPGTNFRLGIVNTSKLNKEATYHIMLNQTLHFDWFPVILSLQDINEDILTNIERPGIPYEEQIKLVQRFKENLPKEKHHLVAWIHLIITLPGQTFKRICDMAKRLIKDGINAGMLELQFWYYLENAPAADPLYKKMHGLEVMDMYGLSLNQSSLESSELLSECNSVEEIYDRISKEQYNKKYVHSFKCIYKNKTMPFQDTIASKLLQENLRKYQRTNNVKLTALTEEELQQAFDTIIDKSWNEGVMYIEQNQKLIDKYGFIVLVYKDKLEKYNTIAI